MMMYDDNTNNDNDGDNVHYHFKIEQINAECMIFVCGEDYSKYVLLQIVTCIAR